jgi:hypothetical protein
MTTLQDRIAAALRQTAHRYRVNDDLDPFPDAEAWAAHIVAALGPEQEARERVVEAARAWAKDGGAYRVIVINDSNALLLDAVEALSDE